MAILRVEKGLKVTRFEGLKDTRYAKPTIECPSNLDTFNHSNLKKVQSKIKDMTYDNFTIKAQESILKAQQLAGSYDQQTVDTPHLIRGIMMTDEHVPSFLLKKMDVSIARLQKELDDAIRKYPKVEGAEKQFLTNDSNKALSRAKKNLKEYGDEYISVEEYLFS